MSSQGKRKAPNGMYWGNVLNKAVMVEPLGNGVFRAWSNNTKFLRTNSWQLSEAKLGWGFQDYLEQEITFFNW
jgi:hypothetical protein